MGVLLISALLNFGGPAMPMNNREAVIYEHRSQRATKTEEKGDAMDVYDEYREPPHGCGTAIAGGLAIIALIIMFCFC